MAFSMREGSFPLSHGKITGALVCLFVVATSAGTFAAWNYSAQSVPLFADSAGIGPAADRELQISNAKAKQDRLRLSPIMELATTGQPASSEPATTAATYTVAALPSTAVEPPKPRIEPRAESRKPVAVEKPKRAEPKGLLDDAQIASLRTRLKLTPTQEEFWLPIEVSLREVVREHARKNRKKAAQGIATQIDVNSPEVQRLVSAAVPLIMRLSEDQKREVRQLARIIGLETVASRI